MTEATQPGSTQAHRMQVVIDCADPAALVRFWAVALGYVPEPPPEGFADWTGYYLSIGVPPDELDPQGDNCDRLVDPAGVGPRMWFQVVPERKSVKNRVHLDIAVSGGREVPFETRKERIDAKHAELLAAGGTTVHAHDQDVGGHYAVTMQDPEGNEFCIH